jgi:hypothetical protein
MDLESAVTASPTMKGEPLFRALRGGRVRDDQFLEWLIDGLASDGSGGALAIVGGPSFRRRRARASHCSAVAFVATAIPAARSSLSAIRGARSALRKVAAETRSRAGKTFEREATGGPPSTLAPASRKDTAMKTTTILASASFLLTAVIALVAGHVRIDGKATLSGRRMRRTPRPAFSFVRATDRDAGAVL